MALLKPIKQQKISDQVFEQLKELIFRGKLKPGDRLLTERDMADSMKVSRTTIRNAIGRLVTMGFVEHRQGKGTFVAVPDPKTGNPFAAAMNAQDTTIYDLLEVRMGLECVAAALAAKRADSKDIQAMEQSLEEMEKEIRAGRLGTEADTSFHMAVAYATKNQLHIQVMKNFYDYLFQGIMESLRFLYENPKNIQLILKQHTAIMTAVINRDPDGAYQGMRQHIDFVKTFFENREK
ncbi:MAG: FadR family transcriptional regulator [Proteobacteria bacterium]|nr:FadR family transcriptional regulator [Pseudomonadota bacterium]MBU1581754.1 FadR family transcriptional regulator [Pseudomonadota bacterium]MBU2454027.1 FadR family transcriptional regulator [Pseudomonadota bacterium]MBU2628682.1 FadR family transcriptional regulator [Pseudomonadota bacterium]